MYLVSEFQFLVPLFMLYRMHGRYGGLPSWRNPAKHPTSPHGSMAAGDCSDAAVQGLCAGRGMVEARGRSCWGTAGAHRSKQRSYVRLRRNTGPKATRHPAWECWRTGKPKSRESPWIIKYALGYLVNPPSAWPGFSRPLSTPVHEHVHKCPAPIAQARATTPSLTPRLGWVAC